MCRSLHLRFYQNVSPECPALLISLQSPLSYQNTCKTFTTLIFEDIGKSVWKLSRQFFLRNFWGNPISRIFLWISVTWSRKQISGQILIKIKSKWLYNPRKWRCMNYKKIQKFKRPPSNEHHPLITHTYFARNWVWILNLWKLELKSVPRQMYVFDEVTNKFENHNFSLTNSKGEVE